MLRRCHQDIAMRTRKKIRASCRSRPNTEDRPPSPENSPPPNSMPNRPAPRKPAASPPSRPPPRLKKPPPPIPEPIPGLPGWVAVRLNGSAVPGAVDVEGGAEKVRVPREPTLDPPPMRASAEETTSTDGSATDRTTAIAWTIMRMRCVNVMFVSQDPRHGEVPLRWAGLPKSEAVPQG